MAARPKKKPRIVDLMVSVLNTERGRCKRKLTRFCPRKSAACPQNTAVPTCCTLYTQDPNCDVCDTCVTDSLELLQGLLLVVVGAPRKQPVKKKTASRKAI